MRKVNVIFLLWGAGFVVSLVLPGVPSVVPLLILGLAIPALAVVHDRGIRLPLPSPPPPAQTTIPAVVDAELDAIRQTLTRHQHSLDNAGRGGYEHFNRALKLEHIQQLENHWYNALGLSPLRRPHLHYIQHHILQTENQCLGRLAGDIEDAILRVLVALSVPDEDLRILEIGVLFGVNAAATYGLTFSHFKSVHLTAIDPLDGYYQQDVDLITGVPVSERVLRYNLDQMGVPAEDYTIIKKYSSEAEAVEAASRWTYNYAFIDGDHTFDGIKLDVDLYGPLIAAGGYVIIDNYGDDPWPDVTRFVDEVMMTHDDYDFLGRLGRTMIFRKSGSRESVQSDAAPTDQ